MSQASKNTIQRRTTASLTVVALAALLAIVGLALALRSTQLISRQRISELRSDAEKLANELNQEVLERLDLGLTNLAKGYRDARLAGRVNEDPLRGARNPSWLGDVYVFDGPEVRTWKGLPPPKGQPERFRPSTQKIKELLGGEVLPRRFFTGVDLNVSRTEVTSTQVEGQPIILAYRLVEIGGDAPFLAAALLDLERLEAGLLKPMVANATDRFQLADAAAKAPYWSERLSDNLPFWALQPAPAFIDNQVSSVQAQTGIFVAITLLALIALLVVVWGLTQVVKREIALSDMKSAFVADVSHELKTPLALIRLFGETLADGRVKDPQKRDEYYKIITRESARLTHLIDNILDFARIDAGRKQYKMAPLQIGEVIRNTYESYSFDMEHHGFEHHLIIQDDLPVIYGDSDAISQAVLNLLGNALKYHDQEKYIAVEVTRETRRGRHGALISVHDCGIGIDPEARRHLFDGFYRAADDRVRQRSGAGLGLALVKHIVDAHDGIVEVESRLVKGSTFRIFLPKTSSPGMDLDAPTNDGAKSR